MVELSMPKDIADFELPTLLPIKPRIHKSEEKICIACE